MTIDRFEPVKDLDENRSLARNINTRNKRLVVIKGIQSGGFNEHERQAFIELVRSLKHPQCVHVLEAFEDNSRICVVEDVYDGGTLKQFLAKYQEGTQEIEEDKILDIFAQLVLALRYLHHERNVVHGEVSTENVLLRRVKSDENPDSPGPIIVKLGSIGLLSPKMPLPPSPVLTKSAYVAPELWQESAKFTPAADIWALGCLIHNLCTRTDFPFGSLVDSIGQLSELITNTNPIPISPNYSEKLCMLCYRLLNKQPAERPTAQQLAEDPLLSPKISVLLNPTSPYNDSNKFRREGDAGSASQSHHSVEAERGSVERPTSGYSAKFSITTATITPPTEPEQNATIVPPKIEEVSQPPVSTSKEEKVENLEPVVASSSPTTAVEPAAPAPVVEVSEPVKNETKTEPPPDPVSVQDKTEPPPPIIAVVKAEQEPLKAPPPTTSIRKPSIIPSVTVTAPVNSVPSRIDAAPKPAAPKPAPVKPPAAKPAAPKPALGAAYKAPQPTARGKTQLGKGGKQPSAKPAAPPAPKIPPYTQGDLGRVLQEGGDLMKLRDVLKMPGVDLEEIMYGNSAGSREPTGTDLNDHRKGDRPISRTSRSREAMAPLHWVTESGRIDLAACLIDAGANVDAKTSPSRETPLFKACRGCQLGMLQLLVERGANVDVTIEGGNEEMTTPLTCAVTCGHVVIVRYLLQVAKASCNKTNKLGQTPLHIAAKYGDLDVAKTLIDAGADVNARDRENSAIALHRAAAFDRVDVAKLLVQRGADLEARTRQGKTALHWAAENNNDCIGLLLLDHGAVVDATVLPPAEQTKLSAKATALHLASYMGNCKFMRVLLDHGADIESRDETACTPLLWACQQGRVDACRLLLERGANVMATSAKDGRGCTSLHIAAGIGKVTLVELLLEFEAAPDARTVMGRTPLHWACEMGQTEAARILIKKCSSLLKLRDEESEATPLFDACWFGKEETVRLLLDNGANVNEKAGFGLTALHAAAEGGDPATVKLLVERGAKINGTDDDKETALHRAVDFGKIDTVRKLLEHGASTMAKAVNGQTPLDTANARLQEAENESNQSEIRRRQEIIKLLENQIVNSGTMVSF